MLACAGISYDTPEIRYVLSYPYVGQTLHIPSVRCIRFVFLQGRTFSDFFLPTLTYANVLHQFFILWLKRCIVTGPLPLKNIK